MKTNVEPDAGASGGACLSLFLIDAIGPFFQDAGGHSLNWSKIPFARLERGDGLDARVEAQVRADFARFVDRVAAIGYNAITLDDLAHLVPDPDHDAGLGSRILAYQRLFDDLITLATARGLRVFVTTDVMYYTPATRRRIGRRTRAVADALGSAARALFGRFPAVEGLILRFGEADGLDVKGDFHSELVIRTPRQVRRLLERLLPVFASCERLLVFRTWSVGAYRIGDLIWNRDSFRRAFDRIDNPWFVISMKHGESDFFRYLPLNKQFFRSSHKKIIELQARREYEGFGQYPSFIGYEYAALRESLAGADNVIGIQVWCQTGGWTHFHRRSFIDPEAVWNEWNAYVTLRLFKYGESVDNALAGYAEDMFGPGTDLAAVTELARLSDRVVRDLLYIPEFARQKLYFRRLRLPPLLSVYWHHIIVNHSMRKTLRCFVTETDAVVEDGYACLDDIKRMEFLAREVGLPYRDIQFQYDTFAILAVAREYYFRPFDRRVSELLERAKAEYRSRWSDRYAVHLDFSVFRLRRAFMQRAFRVLLRRQRGYRVVDRLITIRLLALVHPLIRRVQGRLFPSFAGEKAMGIDTIFR